jgi:hypothetical protein
MKSLLKNIPEIQREAKHINNIKEWLEIIGKVNLVDIIDEEGTTLTEFQIS